jgi:hypothetical protein
MKLLFAFLGIFGSPEVLLFQGGKDEVLATFFRKQTGANVLILTDAERRWKRQSIEYKDSQDKKLKLISTSKAVEVKGSGYVLGAGAYPETELFPTNRAFLDRLFLKSKVKLGSTGGRYTVVTSGPVTLSRLLGPNLKKHVEWHWYFEGMYLEGHIEDLSQDALLRLVSNCIGSRIIEKHDTYYLDFDPREFRVRATSTLKHLADGQPRRGGRRADYLFSAEALRVASDKQLSAAYEKQNHEKDTELDLNSETLRKMAVEKLKNRFPVERDGVKRNPADYEMWKRLGPALDLSRPPKAIITPNGLARAVFYGELNGKPIRLVI